MFSFDERNMLVVRRTHAEWTTVTRIPDVERRARLGTAQDQESNALDESRIQARSSLSTQSTESN